MKTIFRLAKTELRILFCSPVSWLILVIFAFQAGLNFSENFGNQLKRLALEYGLGEVTMQTFAGYTGLLVSMVKSLYLYIPLITMGLMSRELSSGSIKFLYSSPITTTQIILGKYLSMLVYGADADGDPSDLRIFRLFHDREHGSPVRPHGGAGTLPADLRLRGDRTFHVKYHVIPSGGRNGHACHPCRS